MSEGIVLPIDILSERNCERKILTRTFNDIIFAIIYFKDK